jgi:hypothetical protein
LLNPIFINFPYLLELLLQIVLALPNASITKFDASIFISSVLLSDKEQTLVKYLSAYLVVSVVPEPELPIIIID